MQLTWVDRQGRAVRTVGKPDLYSTTVRSPDGTKAAVVKVDITSASDKRELYLLDLERDTLVALMSLVAYFGANDPAVHAGANLL